MDMLSQKQREICAYLYAFTRENGYPPTVREIGEYLGGKSPSTVHFHLKNLRQAGLIRGGEGKTRSITLTAEALSLLGETPEAEGRPGGQVPVVGSVAAGTPILAEECIEDYVPFDVGNRPEEHFALRVRGESMLNAGILPGDLVIVRQQQEARSGEIVVALFEDEATVKTLSLKNGEVWLLPENPDYAPIDGTHAQIIGKVVGLVRQY